MKIIFLVSFLYTLIFANATQVIVGTFSVEKNALETKKDVTEFIASNVGFSDYLQKHTINVTLKKIGVYYVVALEPMNDYSTLYWVLKRIKEKYDDSYVLKIYKDIQTQELIDNVDEKVDINNTLLFEKTKKVENNTSVEEEKAAVVEQKMQALTQSDEKDSSQNEVNESKVEKEVTSKEVKQVVLQQKERSLVEEYLTEILALVAILAVIVIYIVVKRKGAQPEQNKETETLQTIEVIDDEYDKVYEDEQNTPEESVEDFTGQDLMIEKEQPQEESKEAESPEKDLSRRKREVQPHGKIIKEDFSEFAGENIIVAEDNLINQKVIGGLLSESGINIIFANDGQEVLDKLKSGIDVSMILMDAHMPNIDGFEATRIIRNDEKLQHIPIVALSGDVAADDVRKMMESGMDDHLEKPLRMDPLYDAIYAFTAEQEEEKEFDVKKGLEICGGDKGFYHEILNEFVTTYADSDERIRNFLDASQKKEADQFLLDITGITANIGAENLNKIAQNLKLTILKDEYEYIPFLEEYSKHLNNLIKQIKEHI